MGEPSARRLVAVPRYLMEPEWLALFDRVGLEVEAMITRLGLYPKPFTWIFERSMHFLARLRPKGAE